MSLFEDFLSRNRDALVNLHIERIKSLSQATPPDARERITSTVDGFIALILTKVSVNSPVIEDLKERARQGNKSQAQVVAHVRLFFGTVESVLHADTTINASQAEHIKRMLAQSERYILQIVVPTYRPAEDMATS